MEKLKVVFVIIVAAALVVLLTYGTFQATKELTLTIESGINNMYTGNE